MGWTSVSAGMPPTRFARGPTPWTFRSVAAVEEEAAPGNSLSAVPLAREALRAISRCLGYKGREQPGVETGLES